jgi:uncharacterized linocin/CFP29 family protein
MSNHLLRSHAPITDAGWADIDDEARERLTPGLAARRLVDFSGPLGWEYSAANVGRVEPTEVRGKAIEAVRRRVLPVVELRVAFGVARDELAAGDRGAVDVDYAELDQAAQQLVEAENAAVFHGGADGIEGIASASPHDVLECGDDAHGYPGAVARGVELLKRNGIGGPYGLALSREEWTRVVETTEHGGYLLFDHLRHILLDGPLVWAPGVEGAVLVSLRGGDFLFASGQDLSVGYTSHDAERVELYLEESFSFRVATPEAAVAIG